MTQLIAALAVLSSLSAVPSRAQTPSQEQRIQLLEERLRKLEEEPAKATPSSFNPYIGAALDAAFRSRNDGKSNFDFLAGELHLGAAIDPFAKGWMIYNATPEGVEAEEMVLKTTALPGNLTVMGGRVFAAFGRYPHVHDHELPVTDRPVSIETIFDGETQADGVEVSWLVPTPFYLNATFGAYNKIGEGNERIDTAVPRHLSNFTYLGRLNTYVDLNDDHNVELGFSDAWTPKRYVTDLSVPGTDFNADNVPDTPNTSAGIETRKDTWRNVAGVDLTYRYQPVKGSLYRGVVWGTEVLHNDEQRFDGNFLPTGRKKAWGGYSYVELRSGRRWRGGVMADFLQDLDDNKRVTKVFTPFLTYNLSEFNRLRLTYSRTSVNVPGARDNHRVGLQWTGVLGYHVHGFRDR